MKKTKIERLAHSLVSCTLRMQKAFDDDRHDKYIYFTKRRDARQKEMDIVAGNVEPLEIYKRSILLDFKRREKDLLEKCRNILNHKPFIIGAYRIDNFKPVMYRFSVAENRIIELSFYKANDELVVIEIEK